MHSHNRASCRRSLTDPNKNRQARAPQIIQAVFCGWLVVPLSFSITPNCLLFWHHFKKTINLAMDGSCRLRPYFSAKPCDVKGSTNKAHHRCAPVWIVQLQALLLLGWISVSPTSVLLRLATKRTKGLRAFMLPCEIWNYLKIPHSATAVNVIHIRGTRVDASFIL